MAAYPGQASPGQATPGDTGSSGSEYRGNPATSNTYATDGPFVLGVEFKVTATGCSLKGFRFYQGKTPWGGSTPTATLYTVGGSTQLVTPISIPVSLVGGTASSNPATPVDTYNAPNAFDGNTSTRWLGTVPTTAAPQWLRLITPTAQVATGYTITPFASQYSPTAWRFQGSNDGALWVDLDARSGVTWPTNTAQTFSFSNATAYRQHRILMTAVNGATDYVAISELDITGVTRPSTTGGWREAVLATPYPLTQGTNYRAAILFPNWWPGSVAGGFNTTLTSGPLTIPSESTSVAGNNNYAQSSTLVNPTNRFGSNYQIDVIVTDGSTPTTGASAVTMPALTASSSGTVSAGAITGPVGVTLPSLTASSSGSFTALVTGQAAATLAPLGVSVVGVVVPPPVTGQLATALPSLTADVAGQVAGIIGGALDASLPPLGADAHGTFVGTAGGVVEAVLPALTARLSSADILTSAELLGGGTVELGDPQAVTVVVVGPVELTGAGGPIQVAGVIPSVPLAGELALRAGGTLTARTTPLHAPDPRTAGPQWRYVVTELDGTPLGELTDIEVDSIEDAIAEPAMMDFTVPVDSIEHGWIRPVSRQLQVWEGNRLWLRGPILPGAPSEDGSTITYRVHDPSWWWRGGRRRIGRVPKRNLLRNGDFTQGLTGWVRGYDTDSIPKAKPNVKIVNAEILHYKDAVPIKAAQITGVESVTEAELKSSAVFWPNRATFRPGGEAAVDAVANAMPTTAGLKVSIVGHTANDGTGDGMVLSLKRAEAAKKRVHAKRPNAVITTKGVGYYKPNPKYPKGSQEQRRVVISYDQTISGKSRQWIRQSIQVTHPKTARYSLELAAAAWVKVDDDWSVEDANMTSVRVTARRKEWKTLHDDNSATMSDTDPVGRWIKQGASVTIPPDGRTYIVDVYLYAPAALASYTRVVLEPQEVLYFWGVDQADIVKGVVAHMQDPALGKQWSITVDSRTPKTGVIRDREYPYSGRQPVEEVLDEFPGLFAGMDVDVPPHPTRNTVTTYYPRQGQTTDYVFALGANVTRVVPASTRDIGSLVIAQAQSSGTVRDEAYAIDSKAFGGLRLERLITAEQETPENELAETASAELGWARRSTPAYWMDIDPDSIRDVLAHIGKGDTARVIFDGPWGVDQLARIVKRQIHPSGLRLMAALEEV